MSNILRLILTLLFDAYHPLLAAGMRHWTSA